MIWQMVESILTLSFFLGRFWRVFSPAGVGYSCGVLREGRNVAGGFQSQWFLFSLFGSQVDLIVQLLANTFSGRERDREAARLQL